MAKLMMEGPAASAPTSDTALTFAPPSPGQSNDARMIIAVAERIIRAARADLLRKAIIVEAPDIEDDFDNGFEADVEESLTIEGLAARHRRFLNSSTREWSDVDLPPMQ